MKELSNTVSAQSMSHLYFSRKQFMKLKELNSYFIKQTKNHTHTPQLPTCNSHYSVTHTRLLADCYYNCCNRSRCRRTGCLNYCVSFFCQHKLQISKPRYVYTEYKTKIPQENIYNSLVHLRPINNICLSKPNCSKLKNPLIMTVIS